MIKNYPDMSRRHLIVNAPFFINVVLAFIFAFIPERTKKKVRARWSAGRAGARTATDAVVIIPARPRLPPAGLGRIYSCGRRHTTGGTLRERRVLTRD